MIAAFSRGGAAVVLAAVSLCIVPAAAHAARTALDVNSLGLDASYAVNATFDQGSRGVEVSALATVRGSKPWSTDALAFNLSILRVGHGRLTGATVDGQPVQPTVDDQTIIVPLDPPLAPGGSVVVGLEYAAHLNANPSPDSDAWGFAKTADVITAYRWIPWLSRTTPFDRPSVGEPYVTASATHVRVTLTANPALDFAATGQLVSVDGSTRVFEAHDVRDFNFSASPSYRRAERTVRGTKIVFLYRQLNPTAVLDVAVRAFDHYSQHIGAYPYPQLTIGEVGPWSGLESPTLFWMPSNTPARLLPWDVAHETGHQWFYAMVGNDQAREPFADEALTDFISRDLISRFVPSQCPPGLLDRTVYQLGACYPWVIYVQGDSYLKAQRDRTGQAAFWRGLRSYFDAYRFKIGGTRAILAALDLADRAVTRKLFPTLYVPEIPYLPRLAL